MLFEIGGQGFGVKCRYDLITHNAGPRIGLCISRSYAVLDMSHFVTSCDSPKKVMLWLTFKYLQITDYRQIRAVDSLHTL